MKIFILAISLFITIFSLSLYSQDYELIDENAEYFYENTQNGVVAVAIDSTEIIGDDTIFHNFKMFRDMSFYPYSHAGCIDIYEGSLLGETIIRKSNGYYNLLNNFGDTIRINTKASPNSAWVFYKYKNGSYIEAKTDTLILETIMGITDSVRIISLQAKDSLGDTISNYFNEKQFKLSKNYGLIETYDLYIFPNDTNKYYLIGKTNPMIGITNLTVENVYDYDIGDEFHIVNKDLFYTIGETTYIIKSIIDKTEYPSSDTILIYDCERCQMKIRSTSIDSDTTFLRDTVKEYISLSTLKYSQLNSYPYEPIVDSDNYSAKTIKQTVVESNNRRMKYHPNFGEIYNNDSCWQYLCVDGGLFFEYIEGGGGPYYSESCWSPSIQSNILQYYKKGNEVWGTPISGSCESLITSIRKKQNISPIIKLYPNPANDIINIELSETGSESINIEITNISGQLLFSKKMNNKYLEQIDISSYKKGIYFIKLTGNDINIVQKVLKN